MSVIVKGKNARKPWTVRYWSDGRQHEKSFVTVAEARAFKADSDRASRYRSPAGIEAVTGPGPIAVPVHGIIYAVYRLWDAEGACLYVGKSAQVHPILRVMSHRHKPWWRDVATADYVTVLPDQLDQAELDQIRELNPRHNTVRNGWRG